MFGVIAAHTEDAPHGKNGILTGHRHRYWRRRRKKVNSVHAGLSRPKVKKETSGPVHGTRQKFNRGPLPCASCRIVQIHKAGIQPEPGRKMRRQRLYAVTLGRMMTRREIGHTAFFGEMQGRLGNFSGE